MSNSAGVSRKAGDAYPTGAPGPCSQCLEESELLIVLFFCGFVCIIFCYFMFLVVFVWFPSLVCVHGLKYFDFRKNIGSFLYYSCTRIWSKVKHAGSSQFDKIRTKVTIEKHGKDIQLNPTNLSVDLCSLTTQTRSTM